MTVPTARTLAAHAEVLALARKGITTAQIAERLRLRPQTVSKMKTKIKAMLAAGQLK